jgi:hypothetical protein
LAFVHANLLVLQVSENWDDDFDKRKMSTATAKTAATEIGTMILKIHVYSSFIEKFKQNKNTLDQLYYQSSVIAFVWLRETIT